MTDPAGAQGDALSQPVPTERFERVLIFASEEADGLGHGFVTCQHILYALSRETKGLASAVLEKVGVTPDLLRAMLAEAAAEHDRTPLAQIDLADEVSAAIERAVSAARRWEHRRLDTEHLLFGVLSVSSSADEMLGALGVEVEDVLDTLAQLRESAPALDIREEAAHVHRFTLESAWLLSLATDIARRHTSRRVTTVYLLWALMSLEGPVQGLLVDTLALSPDDLIWRLPPAPAVLPQRELIELDEVVQRVLGYAFGEAWNRGHLAVTPLHIAMGLARADQDPALDLLVGLGVPRSVLLDQLERIMPPRVGA
jgi:ATP-dependent Clp protease ATP-binding subunit ClpA